ncbi:MAG: DUF2309 domain-containing protein [Pseudomonadota bacterium]|nr:DUF2309 domain-containing protein [Pseudomonadota bacterium]
MTASSKANTIRDIRQHLSEAVAHFEHVLPGQAPIKDFVHHNTLHGYQHLEFSQALKAANETSGNYGYLSADQFREFHASGRITDEDLLAIVDADKQLDGEKVIVEADGYQVHLRDVLLTGLVRQFEPLTACQLRWQTEENSALDKFQSDVSSEMCEQLLARASQHGINDQQSAVNTLWQACLDVLNLNGWLQHAEDMIDMSPEQAEQLFDRLSRDEAIAGQQTISQGRMQQEAVEQLHNLLERVGKDLTLGGFIRAVTGKNIIDEMRASLVRQLANYLDQGMAAWHHPERNEGFYSVWRRSAAVDLGWLLEGMGGWHYHLESLPDDALETVMVELKRLGLPRERWAKYLEMLALELPGWSGMFLWRDQHPDYEGEQQPFDMMDYLAVRLVMERLYAQRLSSHYWRIEPTLDMLRWYFRRNPAEFQVRHALYDQFLPEYLVNRAHRLASMTADSQLEQQSAEWQTLAQLIWTWRLSRSAGQANVQHAYTDGWRLFRLSQHLGLSGADVRQLGREGAQNLLGCLDILDDEAAGFIWLRAYERHYREQLFNAITINHGRGAWQQRDQRDNRPEAQLVFCMDDREESFRRHLEEINPRVETFGAAAFFNLSINWLGLDDEKVTKLCPVVVTPSHEIQEKANKESAQQLVKHKQRFQLKTGIENLLHHEIRRNLLASTIGLMLSAPMALLSMTARTLFPYYSGQTAALLRKSFDPAVPTTMITTAADDSDDASPEHPRLGYTTAEQVERVAAFLRIIGLTDGFAPLIVITGHGSSSLNNPHRAAYDCGACSGRNSGPNGRLFASLANRQEVRAGLIDLGIVIPEDSWFIGASHNTCDDEVELFDLDAVPASLQEALDKLRAEIDQTIERSAHERCRRLASAPKNPSLKSALQHVVGRSTDFSQARPELGHATNAAAFIGRRCNTQGAFFDRRVFLISYDPTSDPEGKIVEAILLAAGPVGAGISLEYYFSTVNNDRYGCGSKITHNMTGFLGVMEGASSDLRTGLPRQMIEIHEAMRLQVMVEAKTEILTEIYKRQPPLQELVGKGWLLLSAKDPDSETIHVFDPETGWMRWTGELTELPTVRQSSDWYEGHMEPLQPALIEQETVHA